MVKLTMHSGIILLNNEESMFCLRRLFYIYKYVMNVDHTLIIWSSLFQVFSDGQAMMKTCLKEKFSTLYRFSANQQTSQVYIIQAFISV